MRIRYAALPVAAMAVAVGLTACSSGPQSASNAGGGDSGTTLTWEGFSGDKTAPPLIEQFQKDNPGVTVKYTGLPYPQILTQINTQLVSGTAPDVVSVFPGNGNPIAVQSLAKNGYLADLSDQSWVSAFNATKKEPLGVDGKVYLASSNYTIIPAIYNTQALAAVGATPPTTWSQVLDLCATAKAKGKVAYALGAANGGNANFPVYGITATLVYGPNPTFAADQAAGKVSFANSQWGASFQKYLDMNQAGCFSKNPNGTTLDTAQTQVAKGDALGIVTVIQQVATIQGKAPSGTTFQTAPFPATDNASDTVLPVGFGAGFGVNAKSKNLDLAKKFVAFFMSKEGVQSQVTSGSIFPSVPVGDFDHNAALDGILTQAQGDKTVSFPDQLWPNANVGKVFGDDLQKLLGSKASIPDVLGQMDQAYTQQQ